MGGGGGSRGVCVCVCVWVGGGEVRGVARDRETDKINQIRRERASARERDGSQAKKGAVHE